MADDPKPPPPPPQDTPPTTKELARLIEEAASGSKAAKASLEQLVRDHTVTASRVDALEKAFQKSKETPAPTEPAPAAPKSNTPWFWNVGRK